MHLSLQLLALPPPLLLLLINAPIHALSQELEWPYNLPKHEKYYPEDEEHIKREISISRMLQQGQPKVVRKMSDDPGEKFFLDYWSFEDTGAVTIWTNDTLTNTFEPPSPVHADMQSDISPILLRHIGATLFGRWTFDKRDFQCPSGYSSCASINRPNSCCADGTTCQLIQDTGLGDVGCCAAGQTCAGQLSGCAAGYTSCPNNPGGGCCIPGYACLDVGCVQTSTATVVITPTSSILPQTTTVTSTTIIAPHPSSSASSSNPTTVTTTTTVSFVSTSPVNSEVENTSSTESSTSTATVTTTTSTTSTAPNVLTCSTGFRSCPASLGGGCCPTDRGCGAGVCPELSSTNSVSAPLRPTTASTTTTSQTTTPVSVCPTGFYACSAYYQGGCCQIGRDCATSNCPSSASTSLVTTDGLTIIAPTGSGISTQNLLTGTCASGWSTCASTDGGGCCPNGYSCGVSCTATASGGQVNSVGKIAPSSACSITMELCGQVFMMASLIAFSLMVLL